MKAMVLRESGGPEQLKYEEVPDPVPGKNEVVVRLKTAALNRLDVYMTYGEYPGVKLPVIPGADGTGVIVEAGENVDSALIGTEVVIYPVVQSNNHKFRTLGIQIDGTFAQRVKVPIDNVYIKPGYLSWEEAAAIPLAALTAYRSLVSKGKVQGGETVFVPGAGGGVATFLIQIASALGAKVFVSSSQNEKIAKAKKLGAVGGVNYESEHWARELKAMTGGIDLSVDSIGGTNFEAIISLAKPGGRIVSIGATQGPVPRVIMPKIFMKQLVILGSAIGSAAEFADMLQFFEKHQIHSVIDSVFSLPDAVTALKHLEQGENFGKVLLQIP